MSTDLNKVNEILDELPEDEEIPDYQVAVPPIDSFYGVGSCNFFSWLGNLWNEFVSSFQMEKELREIERDYVRSVIENNIVDFDNTNFNSLTEENEWQQRIRNKHYCNQGRHLVPKNDFEAHQKFLYLLDKYDKDKGTTTGALVRDYLVKNLAVDCGSNINVPFNSFIPENQMEYDETVFEREHK